MADIQIGTVDNGDLYAAGLDNGVVWTGENTGYYFFTEEGGDLVYKKTTDGGSSFGSAVTINASGTSDHVRFAVWYDRWTPGDGGNLIHIAWMLSTGSPIEYTNIDVTSDTQATDVNVISTTANLDSGASQFVSQLAITKARGGNLYIAHAARNDSNNLFRRGFERSTDGGSSWSSRADVLENTGEANETDRIILMPGNESDNQNIWAVYVDVSADELSLKTYDDSADSVSETSISASININAGPGNNLAKGFSATVRHTDNHIIVIAPNEVDDTTADLKVWDINGSGSITAKTDVWTNEADHTGAVSIFIDQTSDDLYAVYLGTPGETPNSSLNVYYKKSTDGADTWGSQTKFNADSAADTRLVWSGLMVGTQGGKFQPSWGINTAGGSAHEYMTNADNQVSISSTITPDTAHSTSIIVDWNNDGTFSSTEAIDDWVIALDWNRGKEPEQTNTPTGTAIVKVRDSSGSFVPDSTFWGDGNVEINREIRARTVYQNTTYALFRGRLHRIMPQLRPGNDQLAILFVTDETEVFKNKIVSAPNSALTTGGASPDGDDPREDGTFGGASGIIADILDETSFASGRRKLTETGSTAEVWWTFQTDAKSALNKVEEHEGKKSSIFINSSGTLTFHSSTHREGSTYVTGFGPGSTGPLFQLIEGYELSARDIVNSVDVTIFTRTTKASSVQEIPEPNVTITQGSAYTWIVPLDNAPVGSVTVPLAERDSTAGMSIRGVGGTTYTSDSHDAMVQATILGGGSAIEFTVTNPGSTQGISESIQVHNPAAAGFEGDTDAFPLIVALHDISRVTDSITNGVSISRYGRRAASFEFDFFGSLDTGPNTAKATNRSSAEIANNSTAHANGVRLHLTGSDSDSITQILTRELNDRIRLELPALSLTNKDFYITKGEWTLGEGGIFNVIWTLQEAT